eukprot:14687026-Alexandrium_andersonii.AAC.1
MRPPCFRHAAVHAGRDFDVVLDTGCSSTAFRLPTGCGVTLPHKSESRPELDVQQSRSGLTVRLHEGGVDS